MRIFLIVLLTGMLWLSNYASAIGKDFIVGFTPENPGPNTEVIAKATSYVFDINRATITWIVNDKTALKGVGEKEFSFKTGDSLSSTRLSVAVITAEGEYIRKDFSFKGADVDILWEALTYTPSAYKGKALPSSESTVRITAAPHFSVLPSKLIYEWKVDYKNMPSLSGTGKQSFVLKMPENFNSVKVSVNVSNYNKTITAEESVSISSGKPKILFYEDNQLEGARYNKALAQEIQLNDSEITIKAEPYFFSRKDLEYLSYSWSINNQKAETEKFPNSIFLKKGEGSGVSVIGLKIENTLNILQFAENFLRINF